MRRWFTIFLLILLPCQFTWAAAAAYCQHEKSTSARHIGHHEHEHKAHADTPQPSKHADGKTAGSDAKLVFDEDCGVCQLSAVKPFAAKPLHLPVATSPVMGGPLTPPPSSQDPDRHERPNWRIA